MQRFGRCARDLNTQGLCLLYYEKDCLGDRVLPQEGNKGPASRKRTKGSQKVAHSADEKRGLIDSGLYRYINPPINTSSNSNTGSIGCRRKIILGYYADQQYNDPTIYTSKCCDLCGTQELARSAPHLLAGIFNSSQKISHLRLRNAPPELQSLVKSYLFTPRSRILAIEYPNSRIHIDTQIITSKQIDIISSKSEKIATTGDLLSILALYIDNLLAKYGLVFPCNSVCTIS